MISYLEGTIIKRAERSVIIKSGSIGWRVFLGPNTLGEVQKKEKDVELFTHLYSRDNTQELYGFLNFNGLQFFEMLLTVSGVGPRNAQLIVDVLKLEDIAASIREEKTDLFVKIPGIGSKIAKKIIIDLKSKIERLDVAGELNLEALAEEDDAIEALCSLGYKQQEAKEALKKLPEDVGGLSKRVEEALKLLGRSKK